MTPDDRAAFARLADELLPATGDLPAPSTLGVEAKWLDRALATRPDLEADLLRALGSGAERARAARRRSGRVLRARADGDGRLLPAPAGATADRLPRAEARPGARRRERLLAARRAARSGHRARADLASGVTATRETFAGMGGVEKGIWYLASLLSTGLFGYGVYRLVRRWRSGRGALPRPRVGATLRIVLTHVWIRRRAGFAGYAHAGVFYGFLVLFAGTTILAIQDDFAEPVLGWTFWEGAFYKGYSLFLDVFGAALVIGLCFFVGRRLTTRPAKLTYGAGDWMFVGLLFFLGLSGFALEALRIAIDRPSFEVWAPVGYAGGNALHAAGLGAATAETLRHVTWWVHGIVALSFVAAIPRTKALHMMAGPAGVSVRDADVQSALPAEPEAGYATFSDFLPRHLVDLDSCTRCGRCHEACPATASGLPLSPRDLVLDLQRQVQAGPEPQIASDTLWSCMQCMACVEICPVGIEHVPIINLLRRDLIEKGDLDDGLQNVLEAVATSGNSFGESRRRRARWTRDLDFEVRDARKEPVDVLWFVGDYASLDPRNQRNTLALARLLEAAGVDFGILHDAERTAGNDVRRAGEEGSVPEPRRGEHRADLEVHVRAHPDQRSARLQHAAQRVSGARRAVDGRAGRAPLAAAGRAARGRRADRRAAARTHRHVPRPVRARPLQRRLRPAPRAARADRPRPGRDAPQPRQLLLLRRRWRPHLDARAAGRPAVRRTASTRRSRWAAR